MTTIYKSDEGARAVRERSLEILSAGFIEFLSLIHENFRPRIVKLPIFTDEALQRLTMPVMEVLGRRTYFLDSAGTKRRLERNVPQAGYPLSP